jgi:hypothetical protein
MVSTHDPSFADLGRSLDRVDRVFFLPEEIRALWEEHERTREDRRRAAREAAERAKQQKELLRRQRVET